MWEESPFEAQKWETHIACLRHFGAVSRCKDLKEFWESP